MIEKRFSDSPRPLQVTVVENPEGRKYIRRQLTYRTAQMVANNSRCYTRLGKVIL
jgi:hypothetical protein